MTRLRILGVLTRIALCYLIAGLMYVWVRRASWLAAIVGVLLVGYWVVMRWAPVPGLGWPVRDFPLLDPDRNLAAWMDRGFNAWCQAWLHTGRLYEKTRDPEGLLSTLPAVGTALFGVLAALWLKTTRSAATLRNGLLVAGAVSLALGELWNVWFPINKKLWTSSYVLTAAGWALLALGLGYWLLDGERIQDRASGWGRAVRASVWPLLVYGSNAIAAFCLSELLVETLSWWKIPLGDGRRISAWGWMYAHGFAWNGSTENTSLAFALAYVVVCFLPNWWLWRKKIFLRV
jgi:predicted acyltransferase